MRGVASVTENTATSDCGLRLSGEDRAFRGYVAVMDCQMNQGQKKRIVVVLGMHRAGTSTITRGLKALGVDLGDKLMPPAIGNNDRGFWEDTEVAALNDAILQSLGYSWHSQIPLERLDLLPHHLASFKLRAVELLRSKLAKVTTFGLKDPRLTRLVPFWKTVFEHLDVEASYVIAIRHPLSVAASLKERDGFETEKSSYLWLSHVVAGMLESDASRRLVVDYDLLLEQPKEQLFRIAEALDLPFDEANEEIDEYIEGFLTKTLRHTRFHFNDLSLAAGVPQCATDAYALLRKLARDELPVSSGEVHEFFLTISRHLHEIAPALAYMTGCDQRIADLERDNILRSDEIARLKLDAAARNEQVQGLNEIIAQRDAQIIDKDQELHGKDQELHRRDQELHGKDQELRHVRLELVEVRRSRSWRITAPLRGITGLGRHVFTSGKKSGDRLAARGGSWLREAVRAAARRLPLSPQMKSQLRARPFVRALLQFPDPVLLPSAGYSCRSDEKYIAQVLATAAPAQGHSLDYVPPLAEEIDFSRSPLRLIAFYLPQFHPIPENDQWWGKGFTEWTNVSKAVPQFVGHYQPRLPGELGYYDLRLIDIQRQQIELARRYGIHGFCYHHYWFGGKRLLERPFQQILDNPELDLPFCLCWANENWTRRWDGQEHDVLMAQQHSPEDDIAFIKDIETALRDPRYIRVDGKPLLVVYRVSLLPDAKATARRWRDYCLSAGIGEIYLVAARSFEVTDPRPYGFDAAVEFPPHQASSPRVNDRLDIVNPDYAGNVYDFVEMVRWYKRQSVRDYPLIKAVSPGWDNEPRKPGRGHSFYGSSPSVYAGWLRSACEATLASMQRDASHPPMVFINAWNEWGEGAYLEPDRRYGYANLHATANVLRDIAPVSPGVLEIIERSQKNFRKVHDTAIILHLHYEDLWAELLRYIRSARRADVFISLSSSVSVETCDEILSELPQCRLAIFPNRGRDIGPFLSTLRLVSGMRYRYVCKIHSKKSLYRNDGVKLRQHALDALLGSPQAVEEILNRFKRNKHLGLIVPAGTVLDLSEPDRNVLNRAWLDALLPKLGLQELVGTYGCDFSAGSMFWFRVQSLEKILDLEISSSDFEDELGQLDSTLAHAIERLFLVAAKQLGYTYEETQN